MGVRLDAGVLLTPRSEQRLKVLDAKIVAFVPPPS